MNWESSADIYTLPCVEQTGSGHGKLSSALGDDLVGWGAEEGREAICVDIWLIDFVVQQTLRQHCKATVPHLNTYILIYVCVCVHVRKSLQSCPTLCDPMDHSQPGSSVHGIFQGQILEWVARPSSRRSSRPRDQTFISYITCIGRQVLYC